MPVQRLKEFLDKNGIQYILISHSRAYTAAAIGAITHIPGKLIAKTVIVKLDGKLAMVVVPGSRQMLSCRRMPPGRDPHNLAFAASAGARGRTPAPNHR